MSIPVALATPLAERTYISVLDLFRVGWQGLKFPLGQTPDFWDPDPEMGDRRYALGHVATPVVSRNPLIVLGMNPSDANHATSDRTVNTIIAASSTLGHDGWLMLNLYPERATSPRDLKTFNKGLWLENWAVIDSQLDRFGATEVLGAWGNPPNATIKKAAAMTLEALRAKVVRVYYFGSPTAAGSPRHSAPRGPKWEVSGTKNWLL